MQLRRRQQVPGFRYECDAHVVQDGMISLRENHGQREFEVVTSLVTFALAAPLW